MIQHAKAFVSLVLRKQKVFNQPISVIVDTSSTCNLTCIMCHRNMSFYREPQRQFLTTETLERICSEISPRIMSFGGLVGDPLMNKDICKLVEIAVSNNSRTIITTNGQLLDENKAIELIDSGIHLIKVSIDAATKETYKKIRQSNNFDKLIGNIKRFGEISKEKKKRNIIRMDYVIQKDNIDEIIPFINMARDLECTNITFLPLNFITAQDLKDSYKEDYDSEKIVCTLNKALNISKKLGVFTNLPYLLEGTDKIKDLKASSSEEFDHYNIFPWFKYTIARHTVCPLPWLELVINLDGDVSVCCVPFTPGISEKGLIIGNMRQNSLSEIWNGTNIQRLRSLCSKKDNYAAFKLCRMCVNRPNIWGEVVKNRIFN